VQLSKDTSVRVLTRQISIEHVKVGDGIIACGSVENGHYIAKSINVDK
jgi:hypothetical protein